MTEFLNKTKEYLDKLNNEDYTEDFTEIEKIFLQIQHTISTTSIINEKVKEKRDYYIKLNQDEKFINIIYKLTNLIIKMSTINEPYKLENKDKIDSKYKDQFDLITKSEENEINIEHIKNSKTLKDLCDAHRHIWEDPINFDPNKRLLSHLFDCMYLNNTPFENEDVCSSDNKLFIINHIKDYLEYSFFLSWKEVNDFLLKNQVKEIIKFYRRESEFLKNAENRNFINHNKKSIFKEYLQNYYNYVNELETEFCTKPTKTYVNDFVEFFQPLTEKDDLRKRVRRAKTVLNELKKFYINDVKIKSSLTISSEIITREVIQKAETCGYVLYDDGTLKYKGKPEKISGYLIPLFKVCMDKNNCTLSIDKIIDFSTINDELDYKTESKNFEKAKNNAAKKISILRKAFKSLSDNQKHNPFRPRRGESAWEISII